MNEYRKTATNTWLYDLPDQPLSEPEMVAALYAAVTTLNVLMHEARRQEIEVVLDVTYDRVLDAYRPLTTMVQLKVTKILGEP